MGENKNLADALRVWVSSFHDSGVVTVPTDTLEDLRDGVALMEIMCELECEVLPKDEIRYNTKGNPNVIERNLAQLVDAVDDFYQNYLFLEVGDIPDVSLIGNLDIPICEASDDLTKLMETVLGAAVQCTDRQDYIEGIMKLEPSTQEQLMEVIQTMMARFEDLGQFSDLTSTRLPSTGNNSIGSSAEITKLVEANEELEKERDELRERVLELEAEAKHTEDTSKRDTAALDELNEVNVKLTEQYEDTDKQLEELRAEYDAATREKQAQVRKLNKELEKEAQAKAKAVALTKTLQDENDQLSLQAKEAKALKDREATNASRIEALETHHKGELDKLKEEITILKADGQKQLKDQTATSNDREADRMRLDELKQDLAEATKKAEELAEKVLDYEAEKTEYARNYAELEKKLEEMHDQMSLAPAGTDLGALAGVGAAVVGNKSTDGENNDAKEEKIKTLQEEKEVLKTRVKNINAKARSAVSERDARIKELEVKIATLSQTAHTPASDASVSADSNTTTQNSLQRHTSNDTDSAREINDLLTEKNKLQSELLLAENALRKQQEESSHLQKALEREINQGVGKDYESMVLNMKNELIEKDATIAEIKSRAQQEANRSETEMQLMTSAWFTLGCSVQRASITDRNGGRGPRSFLERQRDLLANKTSIASSNRR